MFLKRVLWVTALIFVGLVYSTPAVIERRAVPFANARLGTYLGSSSLGVDSFKGIPFAQPPLGLLRLETPRPATTSFGTFIATGTPRACPQIVATSSTTVALPTQTSELLFEAIANVSRLTATNNDAAEDCLTLNVFRPSSSTKTSKLPVLFWIYGGGFTGGSTQIYDGSQIVNFAESQGKSVVFVAVNYRLGAFGFLNGKQAKDAGVTNLGLLDQRAGLQWVADNIAAFGGDPDKVTIWGESAGSASVLDQLVLYDGDHTYKGKPLFRGAIMDSGSIVPTQDADSPRAQRVFDTLATQAGCAAATDILACLRSVDYTTFSNAASYIINTAGPLSPTLPYQPRPDGRTITQSPEVLVATGKIAPVPFIVGDQEDEGTLFVLGANASTTADVEAYMQNVYFTNASAAQVAKLVSLYPDDITAGSPFRTGIFNSIYLQYKRLAAIVGDASFTLSRRVFLQDVAVARPEIKSWSYLGSYDHLVPVLGTFHASDILPLFGFTPGFNQYSMQSYYINFVNNLDPNQGKSGDLPEWPQWSTNKQLMNFNALTNSIIPDSFRSAAYDYFAANSASFRV